ncbi:EAL domain-containing protein [Caballeronia sp. EK]|uniref:EAL domain-containing protein n=1 Tax=Caballeronia sp. EK TaxID=2767469 RepID=UPI001654D2F5|nr:EAL domain-containing protein [Caballeronia sp. EK]MBC8642797.1 EAL domain-containing protein [Caballeronia sp. EK]
MSDFNTAERSVQISENDRLDVVVNIMNYRQLVQRYARDVIHVMNRVLLNGVNDVIGDDSVVALVEPGQIRLPRLLPAGLGFSETHASIERILTRIAPAKELQGLLSLAALEVHASAAGGVQGVRVLKIPARESQMHMAVAEEVLSAVSNNRLALSRQPIRRVGKASDVLYDECLARLVLLDTNQVMPPGSFIPSIERAGLVSAFDRLVVRSVIGELAANQGMVLGCNISAQSAVEAAWWLPIFEELGRRPDIAERLVIEVTESAPLVPSKGRSFVQRLQALGCKIAIDDFGVHYGMATGMEIKSPDIIKVDGSLLKNARLGARGQGRLIGISDLARELSSIVVIEGVEEPSDFELVDRAGCQWVQGYLLGRPTEPVVPGRAAV